MISGILHMSFIIIISLYFVYLLSFFVEDTITLGLIRPPGIRILFLLKDSTYKYTSSYGEGKDKFTLTVKQPQSKHKMSIKTSQLNSLYPSI